MNLTNELGNTVIHTHMLDRMDMTISDIPKEEKRAGTRNIITSLSVLIIKVI